MEVETAEACLKRLTMRSWRRGIREMDLVLGPYVDAQLAGMAADRLAVYQALLDENDQDLLSWVLGREPAPDQLAALVAEIAEFSRTNPILG